MESFLMNVYGIHAKKIDLLRDLENKTYAVDSKSGRYILRLCHKHSKKNLLGEIEFLTHLSNHGAHVPELVKTLKDQAIVSFNDKLVVVFKWIEGAPLGALLSLEDAFNVGRLMKSIHTIKAIKLDNCPVYDHNWLFSEASWFKQEAHNHLVKETHLEVKRILEKVYDIMRLESLQVIHSDVHFGNVVKDNNSYSLIDFDGYAMSSLYFDIGVTVLELIDFEDDAYISYFLDGYGPIDETKLNAYLVAACMVFIEWVFTSSSQKVKEEKMKYVQSTIDILLAYGKRLP